MPVLPLVFGALVVGFAVSECRRLRRESRRRAIRWDLLEPPRGEVWIGCGCDWCAGLPARQGRVVPGDVAQRRPVPPRATSGA